MNNHKQEQGIKKISENLLELLEAKGYSSGALLNYRRMLLRINAFMKRKKIGTYTESVGEYFFSDYNKKKIYSIPYQQLMKTTVRRLNELYNGKGYKLNKQSPGVPSPVQFKELLKAYVIFCISIGNKENSIDKKGKICLDFLCNMASAGCKNTGDISPSYICGAILKIKNMDSYAVIRSFLRFLCENGSLDKDLSGLIPKYRRSVPLPATYTDDEIKNLETVIDRSTRTGKRNYAITLLASRLGMRSGDITRMKFDDIDFDHDRVNFVQIKTGHPLSLPLLPEIHEAMQEYVQHSRPNVKSNYLFIRATAPYEKISTSAIRHIFTENFKAAGIDITNKKHGPHALRSSMASSMVNRNIPYDIVRKVLGHTAPQAIKHYAKVDIENLRFNAIDVPAPTGIFAMILQGKVGI